MKEEMPISNRQIAKVVTTEQFCVGNRETKRRLYFKDISSYLLVFITTIFPPRAKDYNLIYKNVYLLIFL